jgi:hypothetical protein
MNDALFPSPTTPPYSLPLGAEEFAQALRRGHGRAWEHAAAHGISDRAEAVIHATLHNLAYDPQCEGDRGAWMFGMIVAAGADDQVVPQLLQRIQELPTNEQTYWHEVQRAGVLAALARRGHDEARRLLYTALRKCDSSADIVAAEEIIDLDGADGLIHVCSSLGASLQADPALPVSDTPLLFYDERHGAGAAERVLAAVRPAHADLDAYLRHIESAAAPDESTGDPAMPAAARLPEGGGYMNLSNVRFERGSGGASRWLGAYSAADIIRWIEEAALGDKGYWLTMWGRRAPDEAVAEVARALDVEQEPMRLARYLRVFTRRELPSLTDAIVGLGEHADADVRDRAYRALARVADARIRELGLRLLTRDRMVEGALSLFESSYQPGDHAAIEQALAAPADDEAMHTIVYSLADVFSKNPLPDCQRLMLFVYERSPCGNCRNRAVKAMQETGTLPPWVAAECRHDAMDELRERFGGIS